ncbi:UNVERIFIED_CONTAM: hypothetical protein FO487_21590, partial [Bacillus amyloliquefaciens DSM 7 = ATCC 23350]
DWTTEEAVDVIALFEQVENAYEKGADRDRLLNAYRRFKEIVPVKAEEKTNCSRFEVERIYSPYRTVKPAKQSDQVVSKR